MWLVVLSIFSITLRHLQAYMLVCYHGIGATMGNLQELHFPGSGRSQHVFFKTPGSPQCFHDRQDLPVLWFLTCRLNKCQFSVFSASLESMLHIWFLFINMFINAILTSKYFDSSVTHFECLLNWNERLKPKLYVSVHFIGLATFHFEI